MEPEYNWKNFRLGTELQIAGSFIYNALSDFDKMWSLYFEEECFEFLYNASIGIERLQKILLILLEKVHPENQPEFEDSLITHSHLELMERINGLIQVKPDAPHVKFLSVLTEFYKHTRYSRYRMDSAFKEGHDRHALIKFLQEELGVIIDNATFVPTHLDRRMKSFISNIIGKISSLYYEAIENEARKYNMYTYELTSGSKAYKIFRCKEYTFEKERLLKRELLNFLFHLDEKDGLIKFIKEIQPIPFDIPNTDDIVKTLIYDRIDHFMMDELEHIYEENPFDKERYKAINILGEGYDLGDVGDIGDQIIS